MKTWLTPGHTCVTALLMEPFVVISKQREPNCLPKRWRTSLKLVQTETSHLHSHSRCGSLVFPFAPPGNCSKDRHPHTERAGRPDCSCSGREGCHGAGIGVCMGAAPGERCAALGLELCVMTLSLSSPYAKQRPLAKGQRTQTAQPAVEVPVSRDFETGDTWRN